MAVRAGPPIYYIFYEARAANGVMLLLAKQGRDVSQACPLVMPSGNQPESSSPTESALRFVAEPSGPEERENYAPAFTVVLAPAESVTVSENENAPD